VSRPRGPSRRGSFSCHARSAVLPGGVGRRALVAS
jgi:hypothetical protein